MPEYLIMGGLNDGKRLEIPNDMLEIKVPVSNATGYEIYIRRQIYSGGDIFEVFTRSDIDEATMIQLLIKYYKGIPNYSGDEFLMNENDIIKLFKYTPTGNICDDLLIDLYNKAEKFSLELYKLRDVVDYCRGIQAVKNIVNTIHEHCISEYILRGNFDE